MKRKISFILATVITVSSMSFTWAEDTSMGVVLKNENEVISQGSIEILNTSDTVESNVAVQVFASTSDNFANVTLTSTNGVKYTIVVNTSYKYKRDDDKIYAEGVQITNIAQDSKNISSDLVIPATITVNGKSYPVISIGEAAFDSAKITSLTVPSSVYEIYDRAFINCHNLKTVTISGTQTAKAASYKEDGEIYYFPIDTYIGDRVFENCESLTQATIKGFDKIGMQTFKNDTSLTNVVISTSGTFIDAYTGESNEDERLVELGDEFFIGCSSLVSLNIDDTVRSIGDRAFIGCTKLTTLNVGKKLTQGLNTTSFVELPESSNSTFIDTLISAGDVTNLVNNELNAFKKNSCISLKNVNVSSDNEDYTSENGILYSANYENLILVPYTNTTKELNLHASTTYIYSGAAYMNETLTTLRTDAGEDGITIGDHAFYNSKLVSVEMSRDKNMYINSAAFANCKKLTTFVTKPSQEGSLGEIALANCDSLKEVTLYGYEYVDGYALAFCDNLTNLVASYGVGDIGEHAFAYNKALLNADLLNSGKYDGSFSTYVFAEDSKLVKCVLPKGLLGISSNTFENCVSLKEVYVNENLGQICTNAFKNCNSLVKLDSLRFLVTIDEAAFVNCTSLQDLTLTRSVLNIHDAAFENCPKLVINTPQNTHAAAYASAHKLKTKNIENDIEDWEFLIYSPGFLNENGDIEMEPEIVIMPTSASSFSNIVISGYRGGFTSLDLSDSSKIYSKIISPDWINHPLAKMDCSMIGYLRAMKFGDIEVIGDSAFYGAASLQTIDFSDCALKKIGYGAFASCEGLTGTLYLPLSLERISESAFSYCTALTKITTDLRNENLLNSSKVSKDFVIDKNAFESCTALKEFNTSFVEYEVSHPNASIQYYLKEIGETAFKDCVNLSSVYFNGNLEKIAPRAFENCLSLKTVTLDNSVLVQENAFAGCENLDSAIIVGEANVAISNDPFCDSSKLVIATTDASKAQTYIDYKKSSNAAGEYSIQLRNFNTINGKAYLQSKVEAEPDIIVYKDGKRMNTTTETAIYTNVLTFSNSKAVSTEDEKSYSYFVNGKLIKDATYVLSEFEPEVLVVTAVKGATFKPGDVDCDDAITASDAAFILQKALISTFELPSDNKASNPLDISDVDCDGAITASDAAFVLQKALISTFELPAEKKL